MEVPKGYDPRVSARDSTELRFKDSSFTGPSKINLKNVQNRQEIKIERISLLESKKN